jgi:ribonucleoside-diphosphate reductase alpha chain
MTYHVNTFSELVFNKKYRGAAEDIGSLFNYSVSKIRQTASEEFANTVGFIPDLVDDLADNLSEMLHSGRFMYGGRIMAAFGDPSRKISYYNCTNFNITDDSLEGILQEAYYKVARISSRGQGVGIDFSVLRPRGAPVNNSAHTSSGPLSFMELFDALGTTIVQDGGSGKSARRMAMLFTLRVDHPDIIEFINCKRTAGQITNANISVVVTREFIDAVKSNTDWNLQFDGKIYSTMPARDLFHLIAQSNHQSAEPGMLFLDTAKKTALPEMLGFPIVGYNGCTEASLDYGGVCNLASLNLASYYMPGASVEFTLDRLNWGMLRKDIQSAVLALDSIITLEFKENRNSISEQKVSQENLRRIGLGVMGFADLLALMDIEYGSDKAAYVANGVMKRIASIAYYFSATLAKYLGPCKAIEVRKSENGYKFLTEHFFVSKFNASLKAHIEKNGLRNAAMLSIAPTGSISNVVGCTSGIEPLYRKAYIRSTRLSGDWEDHEYVHPVYAENPQALWVEAKDVSPMDKLKMVAAIQEWVDQSIANTGNFPSSTTVEDLEEYYLAAYDSGIKGLTVYVENAITLETRGAVLSEKQAVTETIEEYAPDVYQGASCKIGPDGLSLCD